MTLIEIIYTVTIGTGVLLALVLILAFISHLFKKSPEHGSEEKTEQPYAPKIYKEEKHADLFSVYHDALSMYPDFCKYLQWKERHPLWGDRRVIIRRR